MYPEIMVVGMRDELKKMGVTELRTAEEVDRALTEQKGTAIVVVNSICGCAAGRMRPAVRAALQNQNRPDNLFSVFAGLALVLATIGLYGLLAYTTLKRVREIGIRLALGARPAQIRALILSHGMQLLLIGSLIGVIAAVALSQALQTVLFEVKGIDLRIYLGVGTLLFAAAFFASWIPARRATRVDPIVALRAE